MSRPHLFALLLLAAVPASTAGADDVIHVDQGRYTVSVSGHPIGTEEFSFDVSGDSLVVEARSHQSLPAHGPDGGMFELDKTMSLVTNAFDFGLRRYASSQIAAGDTMLRGVEPASGDTLFSVFRQHGPRGEGDRLVLPPGRLFVVDTPPMFSTFGLLCRTLQGKSFDRRPVSMF